MKAHIPWFLTSLSLGVFYNLISTWREINNAIETERFKLNITPSLQEDILLFNRVPKVGSQTVWGIIDKLARLNNFNSTIDNLKLKALRGGENVYLTTPEQKSYVDMWMNDIDRPYSYNKHFLFVDFEEFGYRNPIYINFVRHPVERVISWYYYIRNPSYQFSYGLNASLFQSIKGTLTIGRLKRSIDDCIFMGYKECTYAKGQNVIGATYGGSHYIFHSLKAFNRAIRNVDKYFAVIGVSEDFNMSVRVLEAYIPRFFRNITQVYQKGMLNRININQRYLWRHGI
ncbi:UST [Lepeophtheirus salmonis]|uniref:UST n=1 Tax=Lepeophtheirus salmonis TaxID=72036 RepID=A0A7R8H0N6_LEPSM|nr:UST [Lepeophtheirus salmonis]CAF2772510.1 UST [Lepeophtheirus salmonis]